jgi:uncharacterized membrane protein
LFGLIGTVGFLLARIPALPHRLFDPDEFEHSHAAWCVFRGMLPYKDFFEHHTPWYHYALRPFFHGFDVDGSFESARHFLLFGRGLSLALTALSILLVFRIGRLWEGRGVGLLAGLLLVGQPVFLQKTIEMRPDVPALLFFLAGLWFLLRGLNDRGESPRRGSWYFGAGGLCLGAAIMCTQKMLFVLPGAVVGLGVWSLSGGKTGFRSRMLSTVVFVVGVVVPAALTWGAFAAQDAGREFIANNFLLNARWKHTPTRQLLKLIKTSGPVLALSLPGVLMTFRRSFRSESRDYGGLLLACILGGLFAGVLVIPVAQRQYYLMPLPLACLFAAKGLFLIAERTRARARVWFPALATIVLAVLPVLGLHESFGQRNDAQLARLRYVLASTRRADVVMDGWEGTGVFRPHAFYYYFIHDESLLMLSPARLDAYLDDLESGKIRPRLIAMDKHLAALGPRFRSFVEKNYVSSDGFFYWSRS